MSFESPMVRVVEAAVVAWMKSPRLAVARMLNSRLRTRVSDGIPLEYFTLMNGVGLPWSGQVILVSSSSALAPFSPTPDCSLHVVHGLARNFEVLRVRGRRSARPVLCPVSRGALFVRGWGMSLSLGGRGDTYAARPAVAVVGCDGVSDAITLVVGRRLWCEEAKVRRVS